MSTSGSRQIVQAFVHDPATWVNDAFPIYVVQGLPLDKAFHAGRREYRPDIWRKNPCHVQKPHVDALVAEVSAKWHRENGEPITPEQRKELNSLLWHAKQEAMSAHPCAGTNDEYRARRGARLPREQALHLVNAHLMYANMSVTRYSSSALVYGATDLIFEVDFHSKDLYSISDHVPLIEAAVRVGRRLYDHLVGPLSVDPRYITTTITRQGCRVTVDWRAFGPRRVHELLVVMRWIESQVFAAGDIAAMGTKLGTYMSEIDSGIYGDKYDLKVNEHGINEKVAHWLRPVGALHSRSNAAWGYARATPVPHDEFQPENATKLTWMSRGETPNIHEWKHPEVWKRALRWPEARDPRFDYLIERSPNPAAKLIELFERGLPDLIAEVREDLRGGLRARAHAYTPRPRPAGEIPAISRELLREIVERVNPGGRVRDIENGIRFKCPRAACHGKSGEDAQLFDDTGTFYCHRCKGLSFVEFCAELGCSDMVPKRANSTGEPRLVPRAEVQPNHFTAGWPEFTEAFTSPTESLDESHEMTRALTRRFLESEAHRILFLTGSTGTGKTTTWGKEVTQQGLVTRSYAARDELKQTLAEGLPNPKIIHGREFGENCWHEGLDDAYALKESISKTLCPTCPYRKKCETTGYLSQFDGKHEGSLILHHNHATVDDYARFSNESVVDFVDEDPLGSVIESIDLDAEVLQRFHTALEHDFDAASRIGGDGTIGLDVKPKRVPSSPRAKRLVEQLVACLNPALISERSPAFYKDGVLADLPLAQHLFADPALREAVELFDDADERALYEGRLFLLELARVRVVTGDTWTREAQQALDLLMKDEPLSERQAAAFDRAIDKPLPSTFTSVTREDHEARPPDILDDLLASLRHLFAQYVEGYSSPSALQLLRTARNTWTLRLTRRRPFLKTARKIVVATATAVPERMQLVFGKPGPKSQWMLVRADPPNPTEVTYIADHVYSKAWFNDAKHGKGRLARVLETAEALVNAEHERTKLPVAVIGISDVVNAFNEKMLGKVPTALKMPLKGDRLVLSARLAALTMPLGYLAGYSYGTSGLNTFSVEHEGEPRFVRSLVLLGSPVPALDSVAAAHRGLYAYGEDGSLYSPELTAGTPSIDWTFTYRTVGFHGHPANTEHEVMAARNVPGFRDERANAILAGTMEAEMIQGLGRMRGVKPDPVDPSITPRAFVFSGIPMPGVNTARVLSLEELRDELGLDSKQKQKRGPKPKLSADEAVSRWVEKHGRAKAIERLATDHYGEHRDLDGLPGYVRSRFRTAGLSWTEKDDARLRDVLAKLGSS